MMYVLSIRVITPGFMSHTLVAASFRPSTQPDECHTIQTWHNRLCHINHAVVKRLATSNLVDGIKIINDHKFTDLFYEGFCKGKQHRTSFPVNPARVRASLPMLSYMLILWDRFTLPLSAELSIAF
jgi:hypothetical protein